jgi:hypothetical protein
VGASGGRQAPRRGHPLRPPRSAARHRPERPREPPRRPPSRPRRLDVWLDLERVVDEYWDPSSDPADSRRFWLNQSDSAVDAWIAGHEWAACADASKVVADRELVTLGFDGSRKRARGVTDATALIGCRVSDGHLFELGVWEQAEGPAGEDWTVPTAEVEAAVEDAFRRFTVVGFFADPARWEGFVAKWEAKHGKKLKVKASREHPVEWWMTGGRSLYIVRALEEFHSAVVDVELTHDGAYALTRHALNARRRPSRSGLQIGEGTPGLAPQDRRRRRRRPRLQGAPRRGGRRRRPEELVRA